MRKACARLGIARSRIALAPRGNPPGGSPSWIPQGDRPGSFPGGIPQGDPPRGSPRGSSGVSQGWPGWFARLALFLALPG
jgi:hypothetical protein